MDSWHFSFQHIGTWKLVSIFPDILGTVETSECGLNIMWEKSPKIQVLNMMSAVWIFWILKSLYSPPKRNSFLLQPTAPKKFQPPRSPSPKNTDPCLQSGAAGWKRRGPTDSLDSRSSLLPLRNCGKNPKALRMRKWNDTIPSKMTEVRKMTVAVVPNPYANQNQKPPTLQENIPFISYMASFPGCFAKKQTNFPGVHYITNPNFMHYFMGKPLKIYHTLYTVYIYIY